MANGLALLHHREAGYMARELASGELEIYLPAMGFRTSANGEVANDLRGVLKGQPPSERLQSLAVALPWLALVVSAQGPAAPLTHQVALQTERLGLLFVEVTGNCNERCQHCYAEAGPQVRASLSRETLLAIVDDAAEVGFSAIQFTGGDPFLHPDLLEAVERATGHGLHVEIYTNGLLLTEKRVAALQPHKPSMAFSLYSHLAEVHDEVTRTPGSLKKTLAAIERSVKAGLSTRVGMVAMESNAEHLQESVDLLRSMGVPQVNVTPSFEVGRGEQYLGKMPEGVYQGHGGAKQGPPKGKLCVTYEGNVVPCIFNRSQVLGRVGQGSRLQDVLLRPRSAASGLNMDQFMKRNSTQLQCSDCRTTATALELLGGARGTLPIV